VVTTQNLRDAIGVDETLPWPDTNIVELPLSFMEMQTFLGLIKMNQLNGKDHSESGNYQFEIVLNSKGLYFGAINLDSPENYKANMFIERSRLGGTFKNFHATFIGNWPLYDHRNDTSNTFMLVGQHMFGFTCDRNTMSRIGRGRNRYGYNNNIAMNQLQHVFNATLQTNSGALGYVGKVRTRGIVEENSNSAFLPVRRNNVNDFVLDVFNGQEIKSTINPIAEVRVAYSKGKTLLNKSGRRLPSGALYMFMDNQGAQFSGWDESGTNTLEYGNHLTTRSTMNYYFNSKGVLMGTIPYRPYIAAYMRRLTFPRGVNQPNLLFGFAKDTSWRNDESHIMDSERAYFGWQWNGGWARIEVCPLGHYPEKSMYTPLEKQFTCARDEPMIFEHDTEILMEVEEMNNEEKQIVRQWWNAYLRELARNGGDMSENEAELAEKLLD